MFLVIGRSVFDTDEVSGLQQQSIPEVIALLQLLY